MAGRIRTMLYGDQKIEATELDLLHTPALQRLYDLHQLGLTDRVFVDASHSRLQHVVGVLEQVDKIIDAIAANLDRRKNRRLEYRTVSGGEIKKITAGALASLVRRRRLPARLMGLLHDLTHAPFGHTLEDEIQLQPQKHDDPERQADAFYRLLCQYVGWWVIESSGEHDGLPVPPRGVRGESAAAQFAAVLDAPAITEPPTDDDFIDYVATLAAPLLGVHTGGQRRRGPGRSATVTMLRDLRFAMRALLWLEALHKDHLDDLLDAGRTKQKALAEDGTYPFERLIDAILSKAGELGVVGDGRFLLQRDAFLLDVIGNTICADLLDYAKRDSHFAGLRLDYDVDRIVENFTLVSHSRNRSPAELKRADFRPVEPILRTAISIFSHKLRIDVPGELMNLLQVRFYVYQRVLFHPTKCIAGAMLGSAVQLAGWKTLPLQYRFVGDAVFLHEMGEVTRLVRDLLRRRFGPDGTTASVVSTEIVNELDRLPVTATVAAAKELIEARIGHPITEVLADLHASIRLLDRLSARRYHRPVFRLLPNVSISGPGLNAKNIAFHFLDPLKRAKAEREIELRAELPRGTVTIHCPSGDGPKKIAEILILSERKRAERALLLREIAGIDEKIFAKHQLAIEAVEEMYESMWRLVVSVAPPHDAKYAMLIKRISRVLFAELRHQPYDTVYEGGDEAELDNKMDDLGMGTTDIPGVGNDETMMLELESAAEPDTLDSAPVRLIYSDGRHEEQSEAFVAVAMAAVPRLKQASPAIRGWVDSNRWAANDPREVTLVEAVTEIIPLKPIDARGVVELLGESEDGGGRTTSELENPSQLSVDIGAGGSNGENGRAEQGGGRSPKAKKPRGGSPPGGGT
jgi:HD superfamily phosphohydrolase